MERDIEDRSDIADLVETFYRRAFEDDLLGPIFTDVAHLDLDRHLPIMCDFWETVLFRAGLYQRNAFGVHVALNAKTSLGSEHFERWLQIWVTNVDDRFAGEKAERAKTQAGRIAASIHRRLQVRSGSAFETLSSGKISAGDAPADSAAGAPTYAR